MRDADPREARFHRSLGGVFADGAAVATGVAISVLVPIAGETKWRLRIKSSAAGALKTEYVRPVDGTTVYGTGQPTGTPWAVVANTELKAEDLAVAGESFLLITFTPSGNGAITFADLGHF